MPINKRYLNCTLADVPYLLPYGQTIIDHVPSLKLNETGALLWDALANGAGREALLSLLGADSDSSEEELAGLQNDLDAFLAGLSAQRVLLPEPPASPYPEHALQIGPLRLLARMPESLIEHYFRNFTASALQTASPVKNAADNLPDLQVELYRQPPEFRQNGNVLIRSRELILMETEELYLFLPLNGSIVKEMHIAKSGAHAGLYCPSYADTEKEQDEVFHAMRFAFLIAAAQHGLYVIHSSSLLYQNRAWLFSASSGTGKSTHTKLWNDLFDTPLLNGDLNMLGIEKGAAVCYGIPWNGTSGIAAAGAWPLGGITFLKQSPADEVIIPSDDRKLLSLSQRLISPTWTAAQLTRNLEFCRQLAGRIPIFYLNCTKEPHAAQIMKAAIDDALS